VAKLLPSRLPIALEEVTPETFNKLVRILEINLGQFDPNRTPRFNDTEIAEFKFLQGDVIFNTSKEVLQVYNGNDFINLTIDANEKGLKATTSLGFVSVKTSGNISVNIN
jgi:hypothetical protein|tara:strand:+ start:2349 stop:2678 length:330 start_codon:yes stop_codon:yes gene_type:complete